MMDVQEGVEVGLHVLGKIGVRRSISFKCFAK